MATISSTDEGILEFNIYNTLPEDPIECCICTDALQPGKSIGHLAAETHHIFCTACTEKWMAKENKKTCPLCRGELKESSIQKILKTNSANLDALKMNLTVSAFATTYLLCEAYNYMYPCPETDANYCLQEYSGRIYTQVMLMFGLPAAAASFANYW